MELGDPGIEPHAILEFRVCCSRPNGIPDKRKSPALMTPARPLSDLRHGPFRTVRVFDVYQLMDHRIPPGKLRPQLAQIYDLVVGVVMMDEDDVKDSVPDTKPHAHPDPAK